LETTRKYLKRRIDISNDMKENYAMFLKYFRKLRSVSSNKKFMLGIYEKELRDEKFFLQKNWLLEKISGLKAV
jgi:hypothetical protein